MAFTLEALARVSAATNMDVTINYSNGVGTPYGAVNVWSYNGATAGDSLATIATAAYFNTQTENFQLGDLIFVTDNTVTSAFYTVTAIQYPTGLLAASVTISVFDAALGPIGTGNISANAVTYAKIQQASADTLIGNPTGGKANVEEITLAANASLAFVGTTLGVNTNLLTHARVTMTAAQWNGMYAAPVLLVAAGGANTIIIVEQVVESMTFVSADYAAGGVVGLQYDSTAHLAGDPATGTEAAADFFAAASTSFMQSGSLSTGAAFTTAVNKGIYISNATGPFTTGDSTWIIDIWYRIIPTV
jgi:hypothetical protein